MTTTPTDTPETVENEPSTARLLSVLAIVLVACAGLVLAGVFLVAGSSSPPSPQAQAPVVSIAPHELPAGEAPTVALRAVPDSAGGWNLNIATSRFTWAPDHAGAAHTAGEGHAHVWVGGTKVGRAYGEWFYLPESLVPAGEQTVRVELNGNDHGSYAVRGGDRVAASVTVVSHAEAGDDGHHHQH